jgi:hypothetical protein
MSLKVLENFYPMLLVKQIGHGTEFLCLSHISFSSGERRGFGSPVLNLQWRQRLVPASHSRSVPELQV